MCGLAGALVLDSSEFRLNSLYIEALRDTMVHRGPDGYGTWINEEKTVGFGHRRLSIIDLSEKGHQPMHDLMSRYALHIHFLIIDDMFIS